MTAKELVPKYLVNREGVLSDPRAFEALSDFGRSSTDTLEALGSGVDYLLGQFYGDNLLLLATPDSKGSLQLDHTTSTLPLDGRDAHFLQRRNLDLRGIISRSFLNNRYELVPDHLQEDKDYLEFSREAQAVYAVPIRSQGNVLGVFSIDTSDPRNFRDPRLMPMIHNFVELIMISLINSRQDRKETVTDLDLERNRLKSQYATALAAGWPLSPTLLKVLLASPSSMSDLQEIFPHEDLLEALHPLLKADIVEYQNQIYALTVEGERLAASLRRLNSPPLYIERRSTSDKEGSERLED